jgi:hypothetical protein
MCFSPSASFTATAFLIPTGIYACQVTIQKDSRYLPFALIPCIFGIQQGLEGMEWLGLINNQADLTQWAALGYLFFSHWLWLPWLGLAVSMMGESVRFRKILWVIIVMGILFGASLYLPFLFSPERFAPIVNQGSIDYQTQLIYDPFIPRSVARLMYLLIVVVPLWLSPSRELKIYGCAIPLALIITAWFYNYAFISVWCFFAAILSVSILYILRSLPLPADLSQE